MSLAVGRAVGEALNVMRENKTRELPVLSSNREFTGLLEEKHLDLQVVAIFLAQESAR